MKKIESLSGRLAFTLFLLVFAIGFNWPGMSDGVPPLYKQISRWYEARSYVAVPASVQSTELSITRGETVNESVRASFAYRYGGLDYVSHRVSSSDLSDNFDGYHRTVHERLRKAQAAAEQVTLWVDPAHPEHALYDRDFRWTPALFLLPFTVLPPAVGLGVFFTIWLVWRGKRHAGRALGPHELRPQARPARLAPWTITLFAAFWNMVSWPLAMLFVSHAGAGVSYWEYIVLFFPLAGLAMAWGAARTCLTRWRIGKPMLELLQTRPGLHPIRGLIHFAPAFAVRLNPAQLMHPVRISVKLLQTVGSGEDATESTLWEKCVLDTSLARGAADIGFSVELPAELPSPVAAQSSVKWMLELQTLGATIAFDLPEAGRTASG